MSSRSTSIRHRPKPVDSIRRISVATPDLKRFKGRIVRPETDRRGSISEIRRPIARQRFF